MEEMAKIATAVIIAYFVYDCFKLIVTKYIKRKLEEK